MSLVPYKDDSLILKDPSSQSLMIVNPSLGKLSYFRQIVPPNGSNRYPFSNERQNTRDTDRIASYICPQCGTEIPDTITSSSKSHENTPGSRSSNFNLSRRYFKLLQDSYRQQALPDNTNNDDNNINDRNFSTFIPDELFIPGYFHKFFTTLSLLGSGARGSVFKVVHRIGDTELGVFALKKISIGNDMVWFNKCIGEVKALSSLTHKSVNLITYNHVWLEMDKSYGVTDSVYEHNEKIPCLFILQQYCEGGNLEDCILNDVFKKFPEKVSREERKKRFRQMRRQKKSGDNETGLTTIEILSIVRDIARGLHELHDIGIIHRDLKPSNILLSAKYKDEEVEEEIIDNNESKSIFPTVVIGDLGESQLAGESRSATGCTGTLEFTAPEVIITATASTGSRDKTNYNEYSFASDMYSLGMICYFIVFGELPFNPDLEIPDMKRTVKRFRFNKETMLEQHQQRNLRTIDPRILDLVESLLSTDAKKRPEAKQVEHLLNHILIEKEGRESPLFNLEKRNSITPLDDLIDTEEIVSFDGADDSLDQIYSNNNGSLLSVNSVALVKATSVASSEGDFDDIVDRKVPKTSNANRVSINSSKYTLLFLPIVVVLLTSSSSSSSSISINYLALFLLGLSFGTTRAFALKIGFTLLALLVFKLIKYQLL